MAKAVAYWTYMRLVRTTAWVLRAAFAVAFGFMSLAHGPVMAFSGAGMPGQPHLTTVAVHVHHSPSHHQSEASHGDQQELSPALSGNPMLCYAQGCFTAVAPAFIVPPRAQSTLLGKLVAARPRVLTAALLDAADPPPRLQA